MAGKQNESEFLNNDRFVEIVNHIHNAISKESDSLFSDLNTLVEGVIGSDCSIHEFNYKVNNKIDRFLRNFIQKKISPSEDIIFLLKEYSFVEHHIQRMICDFDGWVCSMDKVSHIMERLFAHFMSNGEENINIAKPQTFYTPQNILNTGEQVLRYFKALRRLHSGDYNLFVDFLNTLPKIKQNENI